MAPFSSINQNALWLEQIFQAKSASIGGVVRRKVSDVERKIGRARLELEVRKRGYHLIECGNQFVIICDPGRMQIVC